MTYQFSRLRGERRNDVCWTATATTGLATGVCFVTGNADNNARPGYDRWSDNWSLAPNSDRVATAARDHKGLR
jgi:hypothetical protein